MTRRFIILIVVVAVVVVGWTAFWWAAAGTADKASRDAVSRAQQQGISIDCPGRSVGGWPFRLVVECDRLTVETATLKTSTSGARAVAQVYDPTHLIVEALAPFTLVDRRLSAPIAADWQSGRASLRIGAQVLDQASVEFRGVEVRSAALAPLTNPNADAVEVHVRRANAPQDLDMALTSLGVELTIGETVLPPFDLTAQGRLQEGALLLAGLGDQFDQSIRAGRGALDLDHAVLAVGDTRLQLSGRLTIAANGHLSGTPRIAVTSPDDLWEALSRIGEIREVVARIRPVVTLALNFGERATIEDRPARAVTLTIRDGYVNAGLVPLGRLKPVFE